MIKKFSLFEQYNPYYTRLSNQEFHEDLSNLIENKDYIPDNYIDIINKETNILFERIRNNKLRSVKNFIPFQIYGYQDEWYYLFATIITKQKNIPIFSVYYKCDQLDGLIKCILHINNNNDSLYQKDH